MTTPSKPNTFTTDFNHRLNTELNASPSRLHDCMNPVLERAAAIADLMASVLDENMVNEISNLQRATQAIRFEIMDAQAMLNAYIDGMSATTEASQSDIEGDEQ